MLSHASKWNSGKALSGDPEMPGKALCGYGMRHFRFIHQLLVFQNAITTNEFAYKINNDFIPEEFGVQTKLNPVEVDEFCSSGPTFPTFHNQANQIQQPPSGVQTETFGRHKSDLPL